MFEANNYEYKRTNIVRNHIFELTQTHRDTHTCVCIYTHVHNLSVQIYCGHVIRNS